MGAMLPLVYSVGHGKVDGDMGAEKYGCDADLLSLWRARQQLTRTALPMAAEHQDLALSASESLRQRSP